MGMIKKIQAFTLNEMLVVLLLTVIIMSMAFAVLRLVQQQMHSIDENYEHNSEYNRLGQSLWLDFNQSDGVWYDEKTNELLFANELKEVTYELHEENVIKGIDTFQIKLATKQFFFLGKKQNSGEIDAMDLTTTKESGSQRLFVYKKNAATSFLNL